MRHIFVVNTNAGPVSAVEEIKKKIDEAGVADICEIYETKAPGDATVFIKETCKNNPKETFRFYACGGDGTINEVADGVYGNENAELSCYPCGSGNDYVKYYGGKDAFMNIKELVDAKAEPIDLMEVCGRRCINVCNFGFDSVVGATMIKVKRKKIIGGKHAYTTGVVTGILKGRFNTCKVVADGVELNPKGKILLCTVANGQYVGGSFKCAPLSVNNDGLLEVCVIKPISLMRFLKLMPVYTEGKHLGHPLIVDHMSYCRAKKVEVFAKTPKFAVCIDGEMEASDHFTVEVLPGAVKFSAPKVTANKEAELASEAK